MSDFSIDLAAEQIYDSRTREYFSEVLGSFVNKNYRSATVMLWSVLISDLIYKLQSLKDLYQDQIASSILDGVLKKQSTSHANPEWEMYLVDEVYKRLHLIEASDYQSIQNLQKYRHLSAHPVLSGENLLFSPNKETVRALIRNTLEGVLLKPPIFSKKIVHEFVQDMASKKDLLPDEIGLRKYLNAKYFGHLAPAIEEDLIKALWKFCFRSSNLEVDANRGINLRCLGLLYERSPRTFHEVIKRNVDYFSEISAGSDQLLCLVNFLGNAPRVFDILSDAAKTLIETFAKASGVLFSKSIFLNLSYADHISQLCKYDYSQLKEMNGEDFVKVVRGCDKNDQLRQIVFRLGSKIYYESPNFDSADANFSKFVKPYIDSFDSKSIDFLLKGIEGHNQTYLRYRSCIDHPIIYEGAIFCGITDLSPYPNFLKSLPEEE